MTTKSRVLSGKSDAGNLSALFDGRAIASRSRSSGRRLRKTLMATLLSVFALSGFPEEITWTDYTGTGEFPDAPNVRLVWKGGGYTVNLADADVPKLERLERYQITSDTKTIIANTTKPFAMKAILSGSAGTILFKDSAGVTLKGDNSGLSHWNKPHLEFENSKVTVASETGLGSTNRTDCAAKFTFGPNSEIHFVKEGSTVFTNYCCVSVDCTDGCGTMVFGSETPDTYLVQKGDFVHLNPTANRVLFFTNNFEIASGRFPIIDRPADYLHMRPTSADTVVRITGQTALRMLSLVYVDGGLGSIVFDQESDPVVPAVGEYAYNIDNYGFLRGRDATFIIGRDDVFGLESPVAQYQLYLGEDPKGALDLNGHDVRFGRSGIVWGQTCNATSKGFSRVKSGTPATFRLVGSQAKGDALLPIRFEGAASFEYCADGLRSELTTVASDSTGDLTVSAGTLGLKWNAAWNGTNVLVNGTGILEINSANAFTNKLQKLVVGESGKVRILSGSVAKFASVVLGAKTLDPGTYTVAALKADQDVAAFVDGDAVAVLEVSAEEEVWTGWPDEPGKTAVVPAGMTVYAHDADADKVGQLAELQLRTGSTVVFDNSNTPIVLTATVSGAGAMKIVDSVGVRLEGDNSGLMSPGAFWITNSSVTVVHPNGLGSAGTGATWVYNEPEDRVLRFETGVRAFTNNVAIHYHNADYSRYYAVFGPDNAAGKLVQCADFVAHNPGMTTSGRYVYFTNAVEFAGGRFGMVGSDSLYLMAASGAMVSVSDGCVVEHVDWPAGATWAINFYGAQGEPARVAFGPSDISKVKSVGFSLLRVKLTKEDVYSPSGTFVFQRLTPAEGDYALDLDGHSQTIGNFNAWTSYGWHIVRKDAEDRLVVTSAAPASVTLTSPALYSNAVSFVDQVALNYDGHGTNVLLRAKSTSTGSLTVSSGMLAFDWGANWSGSAVLIKSGAILRIGAESTEDFFGTRAELRQRKTALAIEDGGMIEIGQGTVRVRSANVAGRQISQGTYNAASADWIKGSGCLRVLDGGIVIIVR